MTTPAFVPYREYREWPVDEMRARAVAFHAEMATRRTVREFSERPVPRDIVEACIRTAATAPSGANKQPWHFVAVQDIDVKRRIREGAEEEERSFYSGRAPAEWLKALAPLGTDARKSFLEVAPWLIVIFAEQYELGESGERAKNYYVQESVGIATGLLIAAVHHAGLASLTHTPSPMGFLGQLLDRPSNERPYLILVVGYPVPGVHVPAITKKPLREISTFV
ncbi:MAG: nitroreductase family protein [Vicinamibacterales bacterium]